MEIKVKSTAFEEGGMIPKKYTCDGPDISPPLSWTFVPKGAKSLALICDDPDAPMGTLGSLQFAGRYQGVTGEYPSSEDTCKWRQTRNN